MYQLKGPQLVKSGKIKSPYSHGGLSYQEEHLEVYLSAIRGQIHLMYIRLLVLSLLASFILVGLVFLLMWEGMMQ